MARLVQRLVHCTGLDTISAVLDELPKEMRSQIMATAVEGGAKIMVIAAKRFARRSRVTGQLHDSITHIVRKYPENANAVAIVGPVVAGWKRNEMSPGKFHGRRKPSKGVTSPAVKYAHLIEFGHHIVKGGSLRPQYTKTLQNTGKVTKSGKSIKRWKRSAIKTRGKGAIAGWVPAKPFMRPAFVTTQAPVMAAVTRGISDGIEKVRSRLVREGSHAA